MKGKRKYRLRLQEFSVSPFGFLLACVMFCCDMHLRLRLTLRGWIVIMQCPLCSLVMSLSPSKSDLSDIITVVRLLLFSVLHSALLYPWVCVDFLPGVPQLRRVCS